MPLFQGFCHRSLFLFRRGVQTYYKLYFLEELHIFWFFDVLPRVTKLPYATINHKRNKKERQSNVSLPSTTADLHTYFLCRSIIKISFLIKNNYHASTITNNTICLFVLEPPRRGGRHTEWGNQVFVC